MTDPVWIWIREDTDQGNTCLGGGMYCPSTSSYQRVSSGRPPNQSNYTTEGRLNKKLSEHVCALFNYMTIKVKSKVQMAHFYTD